MAHKLVLFLVLGLVLSLSLVAAQTALPFQGSAASPRVIPLSGLLKDWGGRPLNGVMGVKISIYLEQEGGQALWSETLNASVEEGQYTVLLGAVSGNVPLELFTSAGPRWLGVEPLLPGERERPRILIGAVPYAVNAETLGGMRPDQFVQLADLQRLQQSTVGAMPISSPFKVPDEGTVFAAVGDTGHLVKFTDDIGGTSKSLVKEDSNGIFVQNGGIGIGTAAGPLSPLKLEIASTITAVSTDKTFVKISPVLSPAAPVGNGTFYNFDFPTTFSNQTITSGASGFGFHGINARFDVQSQFSGPIYLRAFYENSLIHNTASGGITQYNGFDSQGPEILSGSTVNILDLSHFYARNAVKSSGTITNQYGMLVRNLTAGTNNWAVYTEGATKSYFGGNVGIGDANPTQALVVNGTAKATTFEGSGASLTNIPSAAIADGAISDADINASAGIAATKILGTAATLPASNVFTGNNAFTGTNTVTGDIMLGSTSARTRGIVYLAGCETCTALTAADDQPNFFYNMVGPMTITELVCFADGATQPQIQILRDDGSAVNVLPSNLTCNGTHRTDVVFDESVLAASQKLNFDVMVPDGAKRITLAIKTRVN